MIDLLQTLAEDVPRLEDIGTVTLPPQHYLEGRTDRRSAPPGTLA